MSDSQPASANRAVFLSYASQDAEAAWRICEALRAAGVEVWFDQNELVGGDAWDAKIRGQVATCALFVPIISASTQARLEGYFRLEWKLAANRTHTMAEEKAFLLPVVIDGTRDADAKVPQEFRAVQWTRLPGGETPDKFCARVKTLLGGSEGERASRPVGSEGTGQETRAPAKRPRARLWPVPALVGVTLLVALLAYLAFLPRRSPEEAAKLIEREHTVAAAVAAKSASTSIAPPSDAQKLVAQARQIYESGDELDRENLFLADDLVKRALALDSAEPSAWELGAALSFTMVWHSIDTSAARKDLMMRQAARARALSPQSVAAQVVMAEARLAMIFTNAPTQSRELSEIEHELIALAEREPSNWEVQFALGTTYRFLDRTEDSIRAHEREIEFSGGRAKATADLLNVLVRRNRFAEAEAIVGPAVARQRTGRLLTFDQLLKVRWRGDLPAARAAVETWPGWLLQEDRGAFYAWQTWLFSGQPERALSVAQRLPRDYLRDHIFSGPRAVLTARAHELAGNDEAAQADWRTAGQVADRELAANPDDAGPLYWKAWALARLGDSSGAKSASTLLQQRWTSAQASFFGATSMAPLWVTVGRTDLALAELKAELKAKSAKYSDNIAVTRAMLELDPAFAPLRGDPQFREIIAAAPAPAESGAPAPDKSVAVLAFADNSPGHDSEYFSDGISEELINALGKVPGLKVPGSTSSFYFKGKSVPMPEIAKQLGVAYVIEGSVQRAGEKLKIGARLTKASDGFQVWTDSFLRDAKDVFAVEVEIAGLIAKQLSLKLGVSSVAATGSVNPQAFELYVQGRQAWNLRTVEGFSRAEALLTKAIELEPNFARAHSAVADVWSLRGQVDNSLSAFGLREGPDVDRVAAKCELALRLDPSSSEAHASFGILYWDVWRIADSERELREAIRLNPNYASAHQWLGRTLMMEGRLDDALVELKQATEIDPLSSRILDNYAWALSFAGRFDEAVTFCDRALALQSTAVQAVAVKAVTLAEMGRLDEAADLAETLQENAAGFSMFRVIALGGAGRRAEVEKLLGTFAKESVISKVAGLAALKRYDDALTEFDPAWIVSSRADYLLFHPVFDPMRDDPRFKKYLAILGLTEAHARAQAWRKAHPPEKPVAK